MPVLPSPVTLDDVAALAGVSTATVSRFLNSPDMVAAKTGERIRAAVDQLGYIPNLLAGGLASNRSRLVAVLIPQLSGTIFSDIIEAMVAELSAAGYVAMLGLTELPQEQTAHLVHAALARRVEAIILTNTVDAATRATLRRSGTTVIEIWDLPDEPVDAAIGFSHHAIGRDLARFVRNRGYVRPYVITARGSRAQMRRDAFVAEWIEGGGAMPLESQVPVPTRYGQARGCFAEIRRSAVMPDVVICGSDLLAQGLIVEAMAAGLSVPDDLAIIGFGNTRLAEEMRPTISSVDIDGARIAREVVGIMARRAEGSRETPVRIDVGFRLIARESA